LIQAEQPFLKTVRPRCPIGELKTGSRVAWDRTELVSEMVSMLKSLDQVFEI
jgi:hypothetical protein